MNRNDFKKLIGAESEDAEYLPVACLLESGYGCAGYYNAALNADLSETCVLVNARLVEFRRPETAGQRATIEDFNEFLEEIVMNYYNEAESERAPESDLYGKSIPLTAIPYGQIALVYPVAHIGALMRRAEKEENRVPTFLDFDRKSVVIKLLRTKLW